MPKVFLIGEFQEGTLGLYYARAFRTLGCQVLRYDVWEGYARTPLLRISSVLRRALRPFLWAQMRRDVISQVQRSQVDLIIVFKGAFLGLETVQRLRFVSGVPVVNVYPDNPYDNWRTLGTDMIRVLRAFDYVYIWGKHLVSKLQEDGIGHVNYLPFGYDPDDYHHRLTPWLSRCGKRHSVVFIGHRYPKREEWLQALANLDVGIWGIGWAKSPLSSSEWACIHSEHLRGPAAAAVYSQARVAINILHQVNTPAHNMRTFEIPPCGTVMATEATEEIEASFPSGDACLSADNPHQLRYWIERALADPALAATIARRGRECGHPHTYAARAVTLLEDLGFPLAPGNPLKVGGSG